MITEAKIHPDHFQEPEVYRVTTTHNGLSKVQRWDTSQPLILPAPLQYELKVQNQKVYSVSGSELNYLGDLSQKMELKLNAGTSVYLERCNFLNSVKELPEQASHQESLYYLVIQGCGSLRADVQKFKRSFELMLDGEKAALVKISAGGLKITGKKPGMKLLHQGVLETLEPGQSFVFNNSELHDLKIQHEFHWWKFKPVYRHFEIYDGPAPTYKDDANWLSIFAMLIGVYLLATLGSYVFRMWSDSNEAKLAANENAAPVAMEAKPEDVKLPEKFIQERKSRVAELEAKTKVTHAADVGETRSNGAQQAILGDGKLPPGGQQDGPMAPAAAKGNGLPPAENGGALGTLKGSPKDAAPMPKTHKVHVGQGLPKDALFTKQKIAPMVVTDQAGASTKVIALEEDQAKKLLAKKSAALKSAFGSVLGYINQQEPDSLAVTDPNAKSDGKLPKKGGLLVSPNGTGSGKIDGDRTLVLGQVGSEAGKGVVGGTGGSPSGVAGGYGLSTKYKGTGTAEGTGIGGSKSGNLFVDFDALNSTGEFAGSISEGLTKAEVGKVIHAHSAEIRDCYETALIKNPAAKGRMVVDFAIAPNGFVNRSAVKQSEFDANFMGGCLLNKMKSWEFPKPRGGVTVQVTYPFNFRTLGGSQ